MRRHPDLILASASPRRQELLSRLGLPFSVHPPRIDETIHPDEAPRDAARRLAACKSARVAESLSSGLVLAADTVVALEGRIFGKPADADEARLMLSRLSGRSHEVVTGVAVHDVERGLARTGAAVSVVRFLELSESDLDWYLSTREWEDKAGAYAVQGAGAWLVERVEGCPSNVIGLPPHLVRALLARIGRPLEVLLADAGSGGGVGAGD